jgi:hypothetical protein
MSSTRRTLAAAVVAALPLIATTISAPVQAQEHPRAARLAPRIEGFNVDEVRRLDPGTELNFDLYGSPGGVATLRIDGATRNLHMTETSPGTYQGTYTIGVHDRINPGSAVTANLRVANMVSTQVLAESLVRGPGPGRDDRAVAVAGGPRVERFDVQGSDDLGPGNELRFTIRGTPGAKVDVQIAGSRGIFFLPETRPGEYSGVYTIRRDDRIAPDAPVTATIRAGGRYSTATLAQPLLAGRRGGDDRRVDERRVARYCTNCATVEAVNVVQLSGDGNYLGSVGGSGRNGATASGAGRGNERYEIVVRYANGASQTVAYDNDPGFRVGEQVKVNDGLLVRD